MKFTIQADHYLGEFAFVFPSATLLRAAKALFSNPPNLLARISLEGIEAAQVCLLRLGLPIGAFSIDPVQGRFDNLRPSPSRSTDVVVRFSTVFGEVHYVLACVDQR